MSQFIIFSAISFQPKVLSVDGVAVISVTGCDEFIMKHTKDIMGGYELDKVWVPLKIEGNSTEGLFTDCQENLSNGVVFVDTLLGKILLELVNICKEIIFWYGDDASELPVIRGKQTLLNFVEQAILEGSGEVYAHWKAT